MEGRCFILIIKKWIGLETYGDLFPHSVKWKECCISGFLLLLYFMSIILEYLIRIQPRLVQSCLYSLSKICFSPSWCGSVDWVPACQPKNHRFDAQSGHMPGFRARSPVSGTQEPIIHWSFSPSLSPSLPLSKNI